MNRSQLGGLAALLLAGSAVGCSSNNGPAGGPVSGPQDTHCALPDGGLTRQETSQNACHVAAGNPMPDGGMDTDGGDTGGSDFGATNDNSSAYDDDCKYQVSFTNTPVYENQDVSFTVTVKSAIDGSPVTGAETSAEVYLDDTHPAPNSGQKTVESPPGTYKVGPIHFDASGKWTVRFHIFEQCDDGPNSPHGHAAFYISVP